MSKTKRDKDYHFLRNSDKYIGKWGYNRFSGERTKEDAEREAEFDRVHEKYGFKSMVFDKRRRNLTRKSNQKNKQIAHQKRRAKEKTMFHRILNSEDFENTLGTVEKGWWSNWN
jgi:hypothetical protein